MPMQPPEMQQPPMAQPPSQQSMPIPGAGQAPAGPMASQGAMEGVQQAERKSTREVPREALDAAMRKGINIVAKAMYDKRIRKPLMKMVDPNDKVGSAAKALVMLLSEVNKKSPLPPRIMIPLAAASADEFIQMIERTNVATYDETESAQVIMTASEMLLNIYGVDPERAKQLATNASSSDLKMAENSYNGILEGKKAPSSEEQAPAAQPPMEGQQIG